MRAAEHELPPAPGEAILSPMQSAVTLVTLYPPIAAATVVNAFLFAGAWKLHQQETHKEKPATFVQTLAFIAYPAALGLFIYYRGKGPLSGWLDFFGTALLGEAMGVGIVYALLNAFLFSRGRSKGDRIFAFVQSGVLTLIAFAGLFADK